MSWQVRRKFKKLKGILQNNNLNNPFPFFGGVNFEQIIFVMFKKMWFKQISQLRQFIEHKISFIFSTHMPRFWWREISFLR